MTEMIKKKKERESEKEKKREKKTGVTDRYSGLKVESEKLGDSTHRHSRRSFWSRRSTRAVGSEHGW